MKKILIVVLFSMFTAFFVNAQTYKQENGYGPRWRGIQIDSILHLPRKSDFRISGTALADSLPQIFVRNHSLILYEAGNYWEITSSGSPLDTVSLSNRINLKVNISDTSTMLFPYLRKIDAAALYYPLTANPAGYSVLPNVVNALQVINAGGAYSMQSGTTAAMPVAGIPNRFYYETDGNQLDFDNGVSWVPITASGGGSQTLDQTLGFGNVAANKSMLLTDGGGNIMFQYDVGPKLVTLGDIGVANNGTYLSVNDNSTQAILQAQGGFAVNAGALGAGFATLSNQALQTTNDQLFFPWTGNAVDTLATLSDVRAAVNAPVVDTVFVTKIGSGSPSLQTVYAVDGNLRISGWGTGYGWTPRLLADSTIVGDADTTQIAYWSRIVNDLGPGGSLSQRFGAFGEDQLALGTRHFSADFHYFNIDSALDLTIRSRNASNSNSALVELNDSIAIMQAIENTGTQSSTVVVKPNGIFLFKPNTVSMTNGYVWTLIDNTTGEGEWMTGGGGGGSRFGFAGEDVTATTNRSFDINHHDFKLDNGEAVNIWAVNGAAYSKIDLQAATGGFDMYSGDASYYWTWDWAGSYIQGDVGSHLSGTPFVDFQWSPQEIQYTDNGTGLSASPSSLFTLNSTAKGFLPTRMTTTQRTAISSPAEGLLVYDLTLHKLYGYDGTTWQAAW